MESLEIQIEEKHLLGNQTFSSNLMCFRGSATKKLLRIIHFHQGHYLLIFRNHHLDSDRKPL